MAAGDAGRITVARMAARIGVAAAVLLVLDLLVWFGPQPVDLSIGARLYHAGITASGPFAWLSNREFPYVLEDLAFVGLLPVLLICAALRWRWALLARLGGYLGVALWFLPGLFVAGRFFLFA